MVKDEDIYPIDTVVRIRKTGEFARIKEYTFLRPELKRFFMNYLAEIEGRTAGKVFAVYHEDVDLEALPKKSH